MIFLGALVILFMLPMLVVLVVIVVITWWEGVTSVYKLLRDLFTGRL